MIVLLSACFLQTTTPDATAPSKPAPTKLVPEPVKPGPAPVAPGTAPTDTPADTDTDVTTEPEREPWDPKVPYRTQVTAPEWPDPSIHPDMCADLEDGGPVGPDGCVTGELKCGDRIIGHTVGGIERYDGHFYEKKFCWPNMIDHDGGDERVYRLTMPEGEWRAWVTMYTPCADLSMAAVRHQSSTCPTMATDIKVCEMSPREGLMTERLELTTQSRGEPTWYVIVEGAGQEEGAFELVVQCHPGVGGAIPKP